MNIFDDAKEGLFKATTQIMGYDATWTNSATSEVFTARVHYKHPTPAEKLLPADIFYTPTVPVMEYFAGDFSELKDLVDANSDEEVTIDGKGTFYVRSVIKKYDGDTYVATLEEVE